MSKVKGGAITDDGLATAHTAEWRDGKILEALAMGVCSTFTDPVNARVKAELDFPAAPGWSGT